MNFAERAMVDLHYNRQMHHNRQEESSSSCRLNYQGVSPMDLFASGLSFVASVLTLSVFGCTFVDRMHRYVDMNFAAIHCGFMTDEACVTGWREIFSFRPEVEEQIYEHASFFE